MCAAHVTTNRIDSFAVMLEVLKNSVSSKVLKALYDIKSIRDRNKNSLMPEAFCMYVASRWSEISLHFSSTLDKNF